MSGSHHRAPALNRYRKHPRVRVPTPFACALCHVEERRWFKKASGGIGVVYDVSLRGARVMSDAPIKPGDKVSLRCRLPKQILPISVEVATVRWTKDQTFGLEFLNLSAIAQTRLQKFMTLVAQT